MVCEQAFELLRFMRNQAVRIFKINVQTRCSSLPRPRTTNRSGQENFTNALLVDSPDTYIYLTTPLKLLRNRELFNICNIPNDEYLGRRVIKSRRTFTRFFWPKLFKKRNQFFFYHWNLFFFFFFSHRSLYSLGESEAATLRNPFALVFGTEKNINLKSVRVDTFSDGLDCPITLTWFAGCWIDCLSLHLCSEQTSCRVSAVRIVGTRSFLLSFSPQSSFF